MDEDKTSNIIAKLSNKDVNLNMYDGSSTTTINTTTTPQPPPTSPPPISTILPTTITIVLPYFQVVINEPIISLFSPQSTNVEKIVNKEEDEDYAMVDFGDLEFNQDENDVPNNSLMYVSGLEVEYLLKSQESMSRTEATRECHLIFEKVMNSSKQSIELKLTVLRNMLDQEVGKLELSFDVPTSNLIPQDQITSMVSSVEQSFKAKLEPIFDLVLRLPTNAPRFANVSQGGEIGLVRLKELMKIKALLWEGLCLLKFSLRY
ncbi:unnamed protein product [Lactuca saligna]|uniref:Uncharacterized protein n=1 Tax=Lactuca saligna TaxID=75948 RepID=A0AA35YNR1_LACSI|nr:unnamed protein product [Lactuca saligna]